MAPQYRRPGGINIGHQIVGFLIAAVRMIALGQREICGRYSLVEIEQTSTPSRLNSANASSGSNF